MKLKKYYLWAGWIISFIHFNNFYGWNRQPLSETELIIDLILILVLSLLCSLK